MRSSPVSLLGGFNRDDAPSWAVQDVVNWLPVIADQTGTRTQYKLRTPPGLNPYQRIGKGPVRGTHDAEGRLFVVSGQTLFEVSNKGVGIPRGTVPGVGRVRMAHNQIKNGNQLAVANGQSGYIYNTATQGFTRITDEGFPGAIDVVFINGYLFWIEPFGRFWLHSDLADGLNYNTLDRGEAESQPDRIVGVAVNQSEVIISGERTTEFYGNTGQATGTFQSKGVTADVGCASRHTIQNLDNSVMWLGNDGVVYRIDGYRAVPISTRALEKAIANYDWKNAFAFTWEDEGHKVYYLTFPDGETFGYDVVVGLWHRRQSFGFDRWRLNCAVRWNRLWIGGDFQDGRLWQLMWRHPLEGDDELVSEYTSGVLHDDGNPLGINELEALFETGSEPVVPGAFPVQPEGPEISGDAPDGVTDTIWGPYSYSGVGGVGALSFRIQEGALPAGFKLSVNGTISQYTPTKASSVSFVVRVTDSNGLYADLADTITITKREVLPPQLSDWRYLQLDRADATDCSGVSFDDSGWSIGAAPFGGWEAGWGPTQAAEGAPTALNVAAEYDSRFAATFGSAWGANTRLWLRRKLGLASVPTGGITVVAYIEDHCSFYINGELIFSSPDDHSGGTGQTFAIPESGLVVGDNVIAIRCDDEAPGPGISVVYADFIIEAGS